MTLEVKTRRTKIAVIVDEAGLINRGLDMLARTTADAEATAADRVQTGLDREQTGLDRAQTTADAEAAAADRVQTGLDREATAADREQTAADAAATAADRVQAGLDADRAETAAASIINNAAVNIFDFGPVAQGSDDTDAFQAAVDTGYDVFIPFGRRQVYNITGNIICTKARQRIFSDLGTPRSASPSVDPQGHIRVTQPGGAAFVAQNIGIIFDGLTIDGISRITNTGDGLVFQRLENTDDQDGYVRNCYLMNFDKSIVHYGRGLHAEMNTIVLTHTGIELWWPDSGIEDTAWQQPHPFGHRACRIVNNRFHVVAQYCVRSRNGLLRGALISGNTNDIGPGGLFRVDGDIENCVVSDNVSEMSSVTPIRTYGNIDGLTVANNVLAGTNGGVNDLVASPFAAMHSDGGTAVTDLIFEGNRVSDTMGDGLFFSIPLNGAIITNNSFRRIGKDLLTSRAVLRTRNVSGLSFLGNSIYPVHAPNVLRTVLSSETFARVIAQHNNYIATAFNNGAFVDGGGNSIQS